MSDRLVVHYSASSRSLDTERFRPAPPVAEAVPSLAPGQSLALALALSLGLWGTIWWIASAVISLWP
jgi:hypothetical protein